MRRRVFLQLLSAALAGAASYDNVYASELSFEDVLADLAESGTLAAAGGQEELRDLLASSDLSDMRQGRKSATAIHSDATSLIIACEVTSKAAYTSKYMNPIWPRGRSGVTIGIGYDI